MNKLKTSVLLTSVLALTVGCGKNNKEILIDHLQKNNGFLLTSPISSLAYEDGKFQVGCFASSDNLKAKFICDFKYKETIGFGFFQIHVDNIELLTMDLTIDTFEHYYKEVVAYKIYVDNTDGDEELLHSVATIMGRQAREAVNKCSLYLEENGLPYIY